MYLRVRTLERVNILILTDKNKGTYMKSEFGQAEEKQMGVQFTIGC